MLTTSSSNSPSKRFYGISILLSRPTWLNTWPFWQRIWFTTFDGGPCLFCLFRFSIFPTTANFGIWANIWWIKKWRIIISFIHLIRDVTFDNWPYIWWIIKWWIILSHVEPFYPVSGTKYRNPNISKKVLLLHVLKLPCYIHWQLLKYIPQSNIFVIDFLCKDKTIINIEYIE